MWQMDTERSEALEQINAERPDVLAIYKRYFVCDLPVSHKIKNVKNKNGLDCLIFNSLVQ